MGGVSFRTTSGSSACGQSGCQALGLWIAGLGVVVVVAGGARGRRQASVTRGVEMSGNRKDGTS